MQLNPEDIESACEILRSIVKNSEATDQFKHLDLSLISAQERAKYESALLLLHRAVLSGALKKEEIQEKLNLK